MQLGDENVAESVARASHIIVFLTIGVLSNERSARLLAAAATSKHASEIVYIYCASWDFNAFYESDESLVKVRSSPLFSSLLFSSLLFSSLLFSSLLFSSLLFSSLFTISVRSLRFLFLRARISPALRSLPSLPLVRGSLRYWRRKQNNPFDVCRRPSRSTRR